MGHDDDVPVETEAKGYALSGKIMLSAIIILFAVVIFMVVLHLYARWYLLRTRRLQLHRRRSRVNRRAHIVFYVDNHLSGPAAGVVNRGLEPDVLNSLPVFVYLSKNRSEVMECAVCLSEFEDGEKGRLLPKCKHSFHIECIDMWFHSHSTCPLCRSGVEPVLEPEKNRSEMVVSAGESVEVQAGPCEPGSSSGLCATCQHDEGNGSINTTSLGSRRKGLDLSAVRIEVPRRSELENELELSSPASHGFRSPGTRLLSIRRILSMSRKSPASSGAASAGMGTSLSDSFGTELDLESGLTQEQTRSRTQTPR